MIDRLRFCWKTAFILVLLFQITVIVCGKHLNDHSTINTSDDVIFKVYRIFLRTWDDVKQAVKVREMAEQGEADIWLDAKKPGQYLDVMVSTKFEQSILNFLSENEISYKITIRDVQRLIKDQEKPMVTSKKRKFTSSNETNEEIRSFFQRRMRDSTMNDDQSKFVGQGRPFEKVGETKAHYFFGQYNSYSAMTRYMRTIEFYYPHIARLVRIGETSEGRPIEGLKIGYPVSNTTKRSMWIDGNIHAREWASSHTALFIINQLIAGYGKDKQITHYINSMNFFIFPCLNSDGYEYSRSSLSPEIRLWRKNRSPEKCVETAWGGFRCCQGVEIGSSTHPCSNLYAGENAFSEPESKAVANFLQSKNVMGKVDGFISLHTYAQIWVHPYSHELQYYPPDLSRLRSLAEKATSRLKSIYGTEYQVGTGADLLSPASGGSDDWAKESLGIRYVYLVELRPHNDFSNGFILNQDELIPTGIETLEAIKVVIDEILLDNGIAKNNKLFFDDAATTSRPIEQSALHLVKTQTTTNRPIPSAMNINVSVTNMLDVKVNQPIDTNNLPIFQNNFVQTIPPPRIETTTTERPTTITTTTERLTTQTTTTEQTTTVSTTIPTTISSTFETSTFEWRTTPASTTFTWPPTIQFSNFNEPVSVGAAISIINHTEQPETSIQETTTQSHEEIPNNNAFTENLSLTERQQLSEELLKKQLLRIQEINSFQRSTQPIDQTTTTISPATNLIFTSTRRYGPRFLTPPPVMSTRQQTPLSFSSQSTTHQPIRKLPPIVPPRLGASVNVQSNFAIPPMMTTTGSATNKPCRDRKYSCVFWLSADPYACKDQMNFMRTNCAFSCGFCGA